MKLESQLAILLQKPEISDIHVNPGDPIWVRLDGVLMQVEGDCLTEHDIKAFLEKHALNHPDCVEKLAANGDCDFACVINSSRLRCNAFSYGGKMAIAMRKMNDKLPRMEDLGVSPILKDLIGRSKGIFLVTGATGSGKTTTLASIIQYINTTRDAHIITLEDPIEYVYKSEMSRIIQRQVGKDTKSFVQGLKASLREDPDIILIGELRDSETIRVALDAANTGHLVLGTLHTMSAKQSVERLSSFFNSDEKDWAHQIIASTLVGIQSQVLVERASGKGRVMAYEMMVNSQAVRANIKDGKIAQIQSTMETGSESGQRLLNKTLVELVSKNEITVESAMYHSYDPEGLEKELQYI